MKKPKDALQAHLPGKEVKTLVVEAHEPDGDSSTSPSFAIMRLDRTFIEEVAHRSLLVDAQWQAFAAALADAKSDACGHDCFPEVAVKFSAISQSVQFEGETSPNNGIWEIFRGHGGAVLSFVHDDGYVSTGITIDYLVSQFEALQPGEVEVFTRDGAIDMLGDALSQVLSADPLFKRRAISAEDREALTKALAICEAERERQESRPASTIEG